jgi:hypothetical protein
MGDLASLTPSIDAHGYLYYDSDAGTAYHYRTEYDTPKTQERMADRGLPEFLATRLASGR